MIKHESDNLAMPKLSAIAPQPVADPMREAHKATQMTQALLQSPMTGVAQQAALGGKSLGAPSSPRTGNLGSPRVSRLDESEEDSSLFPAPPIRRAPVQSHADYSFLGSLNVLA